MTKALKARISTWKRLRGLRANIARLLFYLLGWISRIIFIQIELSDYNQPLSIELPQEALEAEEVSMPE